MLKPRSTYIVVESKERDYPILNLYQKRYHIWCCCNRIV